MKTEKINRLTKKSAFEKDHLEIAELGAGITIAKQRVFPDWYALDSGGLVG